MNILGFEVTQRNLLLAGGILVILMAAIILHSQAMSQGIPPATTQPCAICH